MTYLQFLSKLLAIGTKLPQLWPIILHVIEDFQNAWAIINGEQPMMGERADQVFGVAETDAEAQVAALFGADAQTFGAIGDGSIIDAIRQAWAFIQANPALMQVISIFLAALLKKA